MTQYNSATTISAWLKEIYADSLQNLVPEGVRLIKMVQFKSGDKEIGDKFIQPVVLTHEHGFTVGSGAFSLNNHIAATYGEAQVTGTNLLLRTAISYDAAARASSSKKAFMKWSEQVVGNMTSSFTKRLEVLAFYGGTSLAKISAVSDSSGTNTVTVSAATWASGIWAGAEGAELDCYSATSGGTHRSNAAALVITAVDLVAHTITVTGDAGDTADIAVNDFLFYRGFRGAEMTGIDKIVTNTGTLYNISATDYALWSSSSYSAGSAALSMSKIQSAVALGVAKGLDEKVTVFCSPGAYANLNSDMSALRRIDGARKGDNGFESITYFGVNGEIEIVPSIYVKEGEAFCLPVKQFCRLGSTDVTMKMPGQESDQLVLQLPSNAGYEMRLFTDQTVFSQRPSWAVKVTGIVNA